MLIFGPLIVCAVLAGSDSPSASVPDAAQFIPTSAAIDIATTVVKAEGFNLSNKDEFYFDFLPSGSVKLGNPKPITLEFYWQDNSNQVIVIDEQSGWAMDTWNCRIYDYPTLRRYHRTGTSVSNAVSTLQSLGDCSKFTVKRLPTSAEKLRERSPAR